MSRDNLIASTDRKSNFIERQAGYFGSYGTSFHLEEFDFETDGLV